MALHAHHEKATHREKLYGAGIVLFSLIGIGYSALTKVEARDVAWLPVLPVCVETCKSLAWIQVPLFGALISAFALAKKNASVSVQMKLIHEILNDFHAQIFEKGVSLAENRVTLFRYKNEWLSVVERSNHLTRKSRVRFHVPDNGNAQGVAGQTWVTRTTVYVPDLPNISAENEKDNREKCGFIRNTWIKLCEWCGQFWFLDYFWPFWWRHRNVTGPEVAACKQYAKKSWIPQDYVIKHKRRRKALPRAMCGIMVEVSGKPWGVIVIDTRKDSLPAKDEIDKFYQTHSRMLERLIKLL